MRWLRWELAFGAVTFAAGTGSANVASEARFFDEVGRRAYNAGQYETALESFQLVHEIAPSHRLLYNIALCADLAGRPDMAFSLYAEYLKGDDADSARRSEAERRVERLKSKLALIEVESDPPGARVFVDRKELGQLGVTPVTIAVPGGDHHLLIERAGFVPQSVPAMAQVGGLAHLSITLEPLFGRIIVNSTPASATLRFSRDGVFVPPVSQGTGYRLPVGKYQVVAVAPGYASAEAQVIVQENENGRLDLGLVPLPRATGRLLVSAGKVAAEVFLDGTRVAITPATLPELGVGEHTLELRAGSRVSRRTVTITKGRATYVAIDLGKVAR